jgi:hypothetical protein
MFDYDVMSEEQALQERFQLLPDGDYQAVVDSSLDKISQNSGNPMMDMILSVYDSNGKPHQVRDFLVFTRGMMWKVIHCAESAGLMKEYAEKKFCSDTVRGKSLIVRIRTEKGGEIPADKLKGKPAGSCYPDKNKVEYYLAKGEQVQKLESKDDFQDDELPF